MAMDCFGGYVSHGKLFNGWRWVERDINVKGQGNQHGDLQDRRVRLGHDVTLHVLARPGKRHVSKQENHFAQKEVADL